MNVKIVIIEDNQDNLDLMVYLLNYYGYNTLTAMDGKEGVQLVQQERPDVVICDIQLPSLNGYEIAKYLKADPLLSAIPLVAVTASSMVGDRDKVLAVGYDSYISKPIDPERFVKEIEQFLGDKKQQ